MQTSIRPFACGLAAFIAAAPALACDGKSHALTLTVGDNVSEGGLTIRLDRVKFIDDKPDKYWLSVKDGDTVLADHVLLLQHDTLSFKTECGTVSIGADRKSMFSQGTLAVNWSYF